MDVFVFAGLSWIFSARKWFKGPVRTVEENDNSESTFKEKDGQVMEKEASVSTS